MRRRSMQLNLPPVEVPSLDRPQSSAVHSVDHPLSSPVHSLDRLRDWNALPGRALGKAGISRKAAAIDMSCDPSLLSARLAGKKHLPWAHLFAIGKDFAQELVLLVIDFYDLQIGLSEIDRRDLELGRTLREAVQRSLAR